MGFCNLDQVILNQSISGYCTYIDIWSVNVVGIWNSFLWFENNSVVINYQKEQYIIFVNCSCVCINNPYCFMLWYAFVINLHGTTLGFWFFSILTFLVPCLDGWISLSLIALLNSSFRRTGYLRLWAQCFVKSPMETGFA